jgi:thioredoxin reductase (NADPH)
MVRYIYKKGTPHKKIDHYDVLVLGGGPAGLTAGLYAARYNLKTAVISKKIGGTATLAGTIENWPGFIGSGQKLMNNFKKQAEQFGARFLEAEIDNVEKDQNGFFVDIGEKEVHGKSLIIALGTENRKLDIPGEKEFLGKGVSYCATCDSHFCKGKTVAVVGGADSAAKMALQLADVAKKVYIVYRKDKMRSEPITLTEIEKNKKIVIHYNSLIKRISGKMSVEKIKIEKELKNKKVKKIDLNIGCLFVAIGATPVHEIVNKLKLKTKKDYLVTDKMTKTSVPGVFAAGDNTNNRLKQVVTAAGEGALAAKSAYDYIRFEAK